MTAKTRTIVATAAPTILTTTRTATSGGGGSDSDGSDANSINLPKRLLLSTISRTTQMLQLQKTAITDKTPCPASQRHEYHHEQLHPIDTKRIKCYAVTLTPTTSTEVNNARSTGTAKANETQKKNGVCVTDVGARDGADAVGVAGSDVQVATVAACIKKLSGKTPSTTTTITTSNVASTTTQQEKQRESRQRYALRPTRSEYANSNNSSSRLALADRSRQGCREFPRFESVGLSQPRSSKFASTSSLSLVSLGGGGSANCMRRPSHRKYKCKINNHNTKFCSRLSSSLSSTLVSVLRQILPPITATTTTTTTIKPATSALSTSYQQQIYGRDGGNVRSPKSRCTKFRLLPTLGATSFITLLTLICLETVLLSTMSTCAKTFYMHWNTSNSIFRIDNTDHIIDVNKGNLAFEFDQVHIICPVYEPGTYENETEKYIIYNVSKVEYETCRITNADPRVIAICDKPQKLMFFTITFRPFTPQPGGLEFLPGNDYYFISTSSKDDLYRRIGGRCSTNNMKVVFKVCCAPEEKTKSLPPTTAITSGGSVTDGSANTGIVDNNSAPNIDIIAPPNNNQGVGGSGVHHMNNINNVGMNGVSNGVMHGGSNVGMGGGGVHMKPIGGMGTAINTNIEQFNRIPIQPNLMGGNIGAGGGGGGNGANVMGGNGIMSTGHGGINMMPPNRGGGVQYPGHHHVQTGIRINNVPTQQYYPPHKGSSNDDHHHYDKHPNEVVKNEELTYNSAGTATSMRRSGGVLSWKWLMSVFAAFDFAADVCRQQEQQQLDKQEEEDQKQQQQQHHHHHHHHNHQQHRQHQHQQQQQQQRELIISDECSSAALHFTQYMQQVYFNIQPLILFAVFAIIVNNCLCKHMLCTIPKRNTKNLQTLQSSQLLGDTADDELRADVTLATASTSSLRINRSSNSSSSRMAASDKTSR